MNTKANIIIAGAGGIAEAAGLLLMEWSRVKPGLFIGNRNLPKAETLAEWIEKGTTRLCNVKAFHLPESGVPEAMKSILEEGDILLDCLPGSEAPRMARLAKEFKLHYANLTEYVAETNEIMYLAKGADTGFVLQTGLAPGYIDVLGNGLFRDFCRDHRVETADKLELKVGALGRNAIAPHFYAFTWSPVGVATEYLKKAEVIRDFRKTRLSALSERASIIIDGITYEEDLTSGGAADLPSALEGKVRTLDYKTLRFPGHYAWVDRQLKNLEGKADSISRLQQKMQDAIPHLEDDQIILYAAVEGKDAEGILRRREVSKKILPQKVGKHMLRAIQTSTAAPLLQAAQLLLESSHRGIILQSRIDPVKFLNGEFIRPVYGGYN
ncbi:saccharopine dehydrogenase family protein [Salegentibacter chungangensis]|uniref:Saccharopine dehydrogenase family protein n=1 Tax=Salegentibacter chungangensis TaxID=1335724 RepID=A0ABW3NRL3_9FLAO